MILKTLVCFGLFNVYCLAQSDIANGDNSTGKSGSQSESNGSTGSQGGNNGYIGSQGGNNGQMYTNLGNWANIPNGIGPQGGNNGIGSQGGNNGNIGSQGGWWNGNNGQMNNNLGNWANIPNGIGQQGGNNGNIGSQGGNNGFGSQGANNGNIGSQGGNNGNIGSQGGNNGDIGSQGGWWNGNNGQMIDERNVERPCHISMEECIKQYFSEHSRCKKSYEYVPDPLIRSISTTFLTGVNLTLTATDVIYSGLNGDIEEFFVNKETDRLVISIRFRNVTYYSKETYYRFHRRAKEPVVNVDYLFANFQSVTTTTIIPVIDDLQLERSETHAFVDDENPRFNFGPKAFASSDPAVRATLPALYANIRIEVQEFFLTEAAFFAATYIQYSICDFGLKIL